MKRGIRLVLAVWWMATMAPAGAQALPIDADVAQEIAMVRSHVVGSMRLTGRLTVASDGAVTAYRLDSPHKVPPEVQHHLTKYVPRWRVAAGDEGAGEHRFSVRVMAIPQLPGQYALSLAAASITEASTPGADIAFEGRVSKPRYPRSHGPRKTSGTVYMLVKVARDGTVMDLMAEQVNLDLVGTRADVAQAHADFAATTAAAARRWVFRYPTSGPFADHPFVSVRVPVMYRGDRRLEYGEWEYYIPGPHRMPPWLREEDITLGAGTPDVPQLLGVGPRILAPLEPPAG